MNENYNQPLRPLGVASAAIEQALRGELQDHNHVVLHDQIRTDAINSVLRAKGISDAQLLTVYETTKVFSILSHLEELSGF